MSEEVSKAQELEKLREREGNYVALVSVLDASTRMMELVSKTPNKHAAAAAVAKEFDITQERADKLVSLQLIAFTGGAFRVATQTLSNIKSRIEELTVEPTPEDDPGMFDQLFGDVEAPTNNSHPPKAQKAPQPPAPKRESNPKPESALQPKSGILLDAYQVAALFNFKTSGGYLSDDRVRKLSRATQERPPLFLPHKRSGKNFYDLQEVWEAREKIVADGWAKQYRAIPRYLTDEEVKNFPWTYRGGTRASVNNITKKTGVPYDAIKEILKVGFVPSDTEEVRNKNGGLSDSYLVDPHYINQIVEHYVTLYGQPDFKDTWEEQYAVYENQLEELMNVSSRYPSQEAKVKEKTE